jgi:hypothetical protein
MKSRFARPGISVAKANSQPRSYFDDEDDDILDIATGVQPPVAQTTVEDYDPLDDFMYERRLIYQTRL